MQPDAAPGSDSAFDPEDMVNASELREFVFCERSWFLARQGFAVSREAQAQRASGMAFHETRAAAATRKGISQNALWWAVILALAAIALLFLKALLGGSQ